MERFAETALAPSDDTSESGNRNRAGEVIADEGFGALNHGFVRRSLGATR